MPLTVEALNRSGDVIPNAAILLISLNPDTIGVDSARVAVVGLAPGPGQVYAKSGDLPGMPFRIVVRAP